MSMPRATNINDSSSPSSRQEQQDDGNLLSSSVGMKEDSLSKSTDENTRLAFVVNIPIGIVKNKNTANFNSTVEKIKQIQAAYLKEYNPETCPPFKIVFCINCHENQKTLLDAFKQKWNDAKAKHELWQDADQITIMTYSWQGKHFPYGQVRNELLHSPETQNAVKEFQYKKIYYPYISIGDADTGSRLVLVNDQPIHIFKAIEDKLNKKLNSPLSEIESQEANRGSNSSNPNDKMSISAQFHNSVEDKPSGEQEANETGLNSNSSNDTMSLSAQFLDEKDDGEKKPSHALLLRPYLIAGGYRLISAETNQELKEISIRDDMETRAQLARTVNPLGPYFPEPNLFIDGTVAPHVNFGAGDAEFNNLKKEMASYIQRNMLAEEHSSSQEDLRESVLSYIKKEVLSANKNLSKEEVDKQTLDYFQNPRNENTVSTYYKLAENEAEEEFKQRVSAYLKNNQHPERNVIIATFFDLAIETETDRLFRKIGRKAKEINPNLVAQHHQNSNNAKPAYLDDRYDSERNGEDAFLKVKEFLTNNKKDMSKIIEFYHELVYSQKTENPEYKKDLLDETYLEYRTKDQEIVELVKILITASNKINALDNAGKSNRTAHELASLEHTSLDIVNTAMATVFGKSINILLQEHWKNEKLILKLPTNSELDDNYNSFTTLRTGQRRLPPQPHNSHLTARHRAYPQQPIGNLNNENAYNTSTSEFIFKLK